MQAGIITIVAFISPFVRDRQMVRQLVKPGDFVEIFCDAALDVCEARDVKGLYKKARAGLIPDFTGISSPYERPENPELTLDTSRLAIDQCVLRIMDYLNTHGKLNLQNRH
jgi:adenylylsulfate kinase